MTFHIFKNPRKAGVSTNRIDPEPYFFRWEACMPLASLDQSELIGQPCYKHKTCGHLIKVPHNRIPPIICSWCGVDTVKEAIENEQLQAHGVAIFETPTEVINLKKETFSLGKIARYLRGD